MKLSREHRAFEGFVGHILWYVVLFLGAIYVLEYFYFRVYPWIFSCIPWDKEAPWDKTKKLQDWKPTTILVADILSYIVVGIAFLLPSPFSLNPDLDGCRGEHPWLPKQVCSSVLAQVKMGLATMLAFCSGALLAYRCRNATEILHFLLRGVSTCVPLIGRYLPGFRLHSTAAKRDLNAIANALFYSGKTQSFTLGLIQVNSDPIVPDRLLKVSDRFGEGITVIRPDRYSLRSVQLDGHDVWDHNKIGQTVPKQEFSKRMDPGDFFKSFFMQEGLKDPDKAQMTVRLTFADFWKLKDGFLSHWAIQMLLSAAVLSFLVFPILEAFQTSQDLQGKLCKEIEEGRFQPECSNNAKECAKMCENLLLSINSIFAERHISLAEFLVPVPLAIALLLMFALVAEELEHHILMDINSECSWLTLLSFGCSADGPKDDEICDDYFFKDGANVIMSQVMGAAVGGSQLMGSLYWKWVRDDDDDSWGELLDDLNLSSNSSVEKAYLDIVAFPELLPDGSSKEGSFRDKRAYTEIGRKGPDVTHWAVKFWPDAPKATTDVTSLSDWQSGDKKAGDDGLLLRFDIAKNRPAKEVKKTFQDALKQLQNQAPLADNLEIDYYITILVPDPNSHPTWDRLKMLGARLSVPVAAAVLVLTVPLWRKIREDGDLFPEPFTSILVQSAIVQALCLWFFLDTFVCCSLKLSTLSRCLEVLEKKTTAPSQKEKLAPTPFDMYIQSEEHSEENLPRAYADKKQNVLQWHQTASHIRTFLSSTRLSSQVVLVAAALILGTVLVGSIVQAASGKGAFSASAKQLMSRAMEKGKAIVEEGADMASKVANDASDSFQQMTSHATNQVSQSVSSAVPDMPWNRRLGKAAANLDSALKSSMDMLHAASLAASERRLAEEDEIDKMLDSLGEIAKITKMQVLTIVLLLVLASFSIPLIIRIATINSHFDKHESILVSQRAKHQETKKKRDKNEEGPEEGPKEQNAREAYEAMLQTAAEAAKKNRTRYALALFGKVITFGVLAAWVVLIAGPLLEQLKTMAPKLAYKGCQVVKKQINEIEDQAQGIIDQTVDSASNAVTNAVAAAGAVAAPSFTRTQGYCPEGLAFSAGMKWDCSPGNRDQAGCEQACLANAECKSYDRPSGTGVAECCLFRDGTKGDGSVGRDCYVRSEGPAPAALSWAADQASGAINQFGSGVAEAVKLPDFGKMFEGTVCVPLKKWIAKQAEASMTALKEEADDEKEAESEIEEGRRLKAAVFKPINASVHHWWDTEPAIPPDVKLALLHTKLHSIWTQARHVAMLEAKPGTSPVLSYFPPTIRSMSMQEL
eukprot:TRINITY_DN24514_c0_g1_i3.p1 TRINITY_DN24514_c0_g1~~TRINITY_DN24514_c0_g1_i3.p1  ORF type:complete len:1452 (-),score=289.17 TRINITY_DN24514_c0_g1_i3:85-4032(-)